MAKMSAADLHTIKPGQGLVSSGSRRAAGNRSVAIADAIADATSEATVR